MHQAIHIFQKDVRYLRFEIGFVVLLSGAFPWLWPVAAAYLIARLIHAEAIPGANQFWTTRPYRWTSLIAAKALFIAMFVNLPFFLVQAYQMLHRGFPLNSTWPGLLWSQILLVFCLSLPAAALAAVTPGMVSFMILELAAVALVFAMEQFSSAGLAPYRLPWPSGVEWISNSFIVGGTALAAVVILVLQFYRRETLVSRIVAISAVTAGTLIYLFLPPPFALNAEAHFTRPQVDSHSIALARGPDSASAQTVTEGHSSALQFTVPIMITGVPPGLDIKADAIVGIVEGASGGTAHVYASGADTRIDPMGNRIFPFTARVDPAIFRGQRNRFVTLRAAVYFSLFGNARSQTIPRQAESLTALDRFRCSTWEFEKLVELRCISAFRWPGELVYAQTPGKDSESFFLGISYSPFPAELSLTPFQPHSAIGSQGLAPPSPLGPPEAPQVTVVAKQPLAHLRRDLEVRGIWLGEVPNYMRFRKPPPPPPRRPKN